ncbi:hypothetical protein [Pelagicoccus albus]|uniref:O-antigen ligase like membrane protein n=1 Tax=Pelagicoccus albus TaxID=415222 RepID=A0A7X1B609_9BACT|nr:hypothetical protein [Pelagicoccus albus]MBC2606265.1 hypothetical protein [Pelagicoccus albus]
MSNSGDPGLLTENGRAVSAESDSGFLRLVIGLWCSVLGVLSFLLIPSVQGTVPAYMLAFASVPVCLLVFYENNSGQLGAYLRDWGLLAVFWFFFFAASQLSYFINGSGIITGFEYISGGSSMLFRTSSITQSAYLLACFATFTFFRHWDMKDLSSLFFLAAWVVAIYGIYEWLFYLITGTTGDFLVNRVFEGVEGDHTASWSQSVSVAGLDLLRVKSTLGEPSFFSAVAVPFLFAAYLSRRWYLAMALLFCVIFTWSTSAFAGVGVGLLLLVVVGGQQRAISITLLALAAFAMLCIIVFLPDLFRSMVTDKLTGLNESGAIRMDIDELRTKGLAELPLWNHIFGIGYGYVYGSVWSATVQNIGWLGSACFLAFFGVPFVYCYIRGLFSVWGFGCLIILVLYIVNVAELYLPTTWAFLGLAWRHYDAARFEAAEETE